MEPQIQLESIKNIDDIDSKYDSKLEIELSKRLKRNPLPSELTNADNDSDLVNEVFWQLIKDLSARIETLENNNGAKTDSVVPIV